VLMVAVPLAWWCRVQDGWRLGFHGKMMTGQRWKTRRHYSLFHCEEKPFHHKHLIKFPRNLETDRNKRNWRLPEIRIEFCDVTVGIVNKVKFGRSENINAFRQRQKFKSPDLSQLQLIRPIIPLNGYFGASS